MKVLATQRWAVAAVVLTVAIAFVLPAAAADKKKFSVDTKVKATVSRGIINLEDQPRHQLTQTVSTRTMTSTNPDFNNVEVTNFGQADSIKGTGTHNGYSFHYHKNGEKVFMKWEGTHQTLFKEDKSWETISEGTITFIGGTGKFSNITGGGTYTCKASPKTADCHADLEAEY